MEIRTVYTNTDLNNHCLHCGNRCNKAIAFIGDTASIHLYLCDGCQLKKQDIVNHIFPLLQKVILQGS